MVGVCICEHHGRAGLADVCIHIHEAVTSRSGAHNVVTARFKVGNLGNQQDTDVIFTLFYCATCATEYGFPTSNCELPEADWEEFDTRGQFTAVCYECMKEVTSG